MAAQHADEGAPELGAVAPAAGAEVPRAALQVAVGLAVEVAVERALVAVELGVLGMHVEEEPCLAELARDEHRVHALPEEVRGIEVGAEDGLALDAGLLLRKLAELDQRLAVVDAEAGVRLPRGAHAVLGAELGLCGPVRHQHGVPLVLEDVEEVAGPRAGDPVGGLVLLRSTGAAAEGDHHLGAELRCELHRGDVVVVVLLGEALLRVHRVAVHGERGADEAAVLQDALDAVLLLLAGQHLLRVEVGLAGPGTHGKLDGAKADVGDVVADLLEGAAGEECGHDAKLHDGPFGARTPAGAGSPPRRARRGPRRRRPGPGRP